MEIEFVGAAQTVTGSKHLVRTAHATILLDCGLFQGKRRESIEKNRTLGLAARELDAVVLSHAHMDHSGALPLLGKNGYDGPIYATPATRDLCAVMLEDSAMLQANDARYINKVIDRDHVDMDYVEPLYDDQDVVRALKQLETVSYGRRHPIADGVTLTFLDAGHVLGSAITILDVEEDGKTKRLVFTGDLGRRHIPILRDPEVAPHAQTLIMESTYGDRLHAPIEQMHEDLATVIKRAIQRGGKVIIPSFALERAQEIVYAMKTLRQAGKIPRIPVYVDSPLTVKITDVFKMHPDCYDEEARAMLASSGSPFEFEDLRYISDKEDSKALDASSDACVIISASGMCEGGRVVHHLKASIESEKNTVVIVGYQAQHTLGRRLVEKRPRVKIFGVERELRAEVVVLNGFSAHADQKDLVAYAQAMGKLDNVVLVHGDPQPQRVLKEKLGEHGYDRVFAPAAGDRLTV